MFFRCSVVFQLKEEGQPHIKTCNYVKCRTIQQLSLVSNASAVSFIIQAAEHVAQSIQQRKTLQNHIWPRSLLETPRNHFGLGSDNRHESASDQNMLKSHSYARIPIDEILYAGYICDSDNSWALTDASIGQGIRQSIREKATSQQGSKKVGKGHTVPFCHHPSSHCFLLAQGIYFGQSHELYEVHGTCLFRRQQIPELSDLPEYQPKHWMNPYH